MEIQRTINKIIHHYLKTMILRNIMLYKYNSFLTLKTQTTFILRYRNYTNIRITLVKGNGD